MGNSLISVGDIGDPIESPCTYPPLLPMATKMHVFLFNNGFPGIEFRLDLFVNPSHAQLCVFHLGLLLAYMPTSSRHLATQLSPNTHALSLENRVQWAR
jgi:hypothetical protein